jgi:hypothetical protein
VTLPEDFDKKGANLSEWTGVARLGVCGGLGGGVAKTAEPLAKAGGVVSSGVGSVCAMAGGLLGITWVSGVDLVGP